MKTREEMPASGMLIRELRSVVNRKGARREGIKIEILSKICGGTIDDSMELIA